MKNTSYRSPGAEKKAIRARKHESERFDHKIFVYVSTDQYKHLTEVADSRGLSVSCLIRESLARCGLL